MTVEKVNQAVESLVGFNRKDWNTIKRAVDMEFEKMANKCELTSGNCELAAKNASDELMLSNNLNA